MQWRGPNRARIAIDLMRSKNSREDPHLHRGREYRDLRNVDLSEGTIKDRNGWTKLSSTSVNIDYCVGGFQWLELDGTAKEVFIRDTPMIYDATQDPPTGLTLNTFADPSTPASSAAFSWSASNLASFAQRHDDVYVALGDNGSQLNLRIDGDGQVYTAGMLAPAAPTASMLAGSVGAGTRLYRLVYKDNGKGYYGAVSGTVQVTFADNQQAQLTIGTYPGSGRTVWREVHVSGDTGTTWKVLSSVKDNTTTTVNDNNPSLDTLATAGTFYSTIPSCKYVCARSDGIFFWANDTTNSLPARIYYSAGTNLPENRGGLIEVGEPADPITGMIPLHDGILIAKRDSFYRIPRGQYAAIRILNGIGCVAHNTMIELQGGVAFLSRQGPRFLRGQDAPFVAQDQYGPSGGAVRFILEGDWASVAKDTLANAFAAHFRDKGVIKWFVQTDNTKNYSQEAIVWDYRKNICWPDDAFLWQAWRCHVQGSEEERVHGAMPYGFVGRLDHGEADGLSEFLSGGVTAADATSLTADIDTIPTGGSGVRGTRVYIYDGTAQGERQWVGSSGSDALYLDGSWGTNPDATSKWTLGVEERVPFDIDGIGPGDVGISPEWEDVEVHFA